MPPDIGRTRPHLWCRPRRRACASNYFNWGTGDTNASNGLYVYVLTGPTFEAATQLSNVWNSFNQGWQTAVMDLQAYRGQTIKLQFVTYSGNGRYDKSRIDNVSLNTEVPGWVLSSASLSSVQNTGGLTGSYLYLGRYSLSADSTAFLIPTNTDSLRLHLSRSRLLSI